MNRNYQEIDNLVAAAAKLLRVAGAPVYWAGEIFANKITSSLKITIQEDAGTHFGDWPTGITFDIRLSKTKI